MNKRNNYLKSIKIENYRGFSSLEIKGFSDVNLLGGMNGAGKSTVLESIFLLMDRANPMCVMRPQVFRNINSSINNSFSRIFFQNNKNESALISAETRNALECVEIICESRSTARSENIDLTKKVGNLSDSANFSSLGLTVKSHVNGEVESEVHLTEIPNGVSVEELKKSSVRIPHSVILNRSTFSYPADLSNRLSSAIREGKKSEFISKVKKISPSVKGLEVLFEGEAGLVHAELKGGQILPIQLVGDGCHVLLSICLAIWASRNGIVLVDEFDASIHYSKLVEVWKVIIDYARANNCQVFIATHSRECIEAAAQALNQSTSKGFRYFRVESSNGTSRAIKYDGKEISVAMDQEWEVR